MSKHDNTDGHAKQTLDCVDMKRAIQEQLAREQEGTPREALNEATAKKAANDPHLARFLKGGPGTRTMRRAG